MHASITSLLVPENLRSVAGLELLARLSAESLLQGLNSSRRTGAGLTFSQYRSYEPGDDLRRLDWKLYARSDRFFVRESELETNLTIRFLLDASRSMLHEDKRGLSKLDYARYLIATLAWLAQRQGDTLALFALNDQQVYALNPRPGEHYFARFLHELLSIQAEGRFPEDRPARQLLPGSRSRELIVFVSDWHEASGELSQTLQSLSKTGHELVLFHLLARNELELDYPGGGVFEDLETGRQLQLDPERIRAAYQARMQAELAELERQMLEWRVAYQRMICDEAAGEALRHFLRRRSRLR